MGVEPLEDTIPLPQIVRSMKNLTSTAHGRSSAVDHYRTGGTFDGGSKPGVQAREQEASAGSSGPSSELRQRSQGDRVWEEVEYLLDSLGHIKAMLTNGTDWDPNEVKWINERYHLCKRQALDYVLCLNIATVLETVSFPGEHLTYLEVAKRVVTDCTEWELAEAIRQIGLKPCERVYYKARTDLVSVERAEELLLSMIADGEYVLAGDFVKALGVTAKSATYTTLKKELASKGWKWKSKKVDRKVVWVIRR
jgi:hypothetical protein